MIRAPAMYGYILCIAGLLSVAGCNRSDSAVAVPVRVVDLMREFEKAERRPPTGFRVGIHPTGGVARPAIIMPAPSRVIWNLPLPRGGVLHAYVAIEAAPGAPAAPVRFRIGISDYRIYDPLTEMTLTPEQRGWMDLRVDLSAYAGWKWSLFYRPNRIIWRVVVSADAPQGPATAVLGSPEILADTRSAKEYVARVRKLDAARDR